MTFNIVAMICVAGTAPRIAAGARLSREVITARSPMRSNALDSPSRCWESRTFQNLAEGEFIKIMCVRNG